MCQCIKWYSNDTIIKTHVYLKLWQIESNWIRISLPLPVIFKHSPWISRAVDFQLWRPPASLSRIFNSCASEKHSAVTAWSRGAMEIIVQKTMQIHLSKKEKITKPTKQNFNTHESKKAHTDAQKSILFGNEAMTIFMKYSSMHVMSVSSSETQYIPRKLIETLASTVNGDGIWHPNAIGVCVCVCACVCVWTRLRKKNDETLDAWGKSSKQNSFLVISPLAWRHLRLQTSRVCCPRFCWKKNSTRVFQKKKGNHEKQRRKPWNGFHFENFSKFCKSSSTANRALTIFTLYAEM